MLMTEVNLHIHQQQVHLGFIWGKRRQPRLTGGLSDRRHIRRKERADPAGVIERWKLGHA